ncbi:endonuclease/exonuclease/phosphatase family protein [Blastococcus sp. TBT05-19]|uniref:endonuclease/exonuclease/phosphatase family protein n=1 Tax=Blastococcus sp. TBT05-19 TaxID=2250581 RepID=UPI000DEB1888|nr:endonuclease/exonuclease/phosphatase family protein [Blastococcus sp. TBT05-19]RBY92312.1 endonuclease/exonuclease/phosphatase family protein [Blastococcus sp. TBT05-19]
MRLPPAPRRRWAVAAALPWAAWAALRVAGAERGFPLVPALAFTPHAAATAVLPLAVAAAARSRTGALVAGAAGLALAGAVRGNRGTRRPLPPGGTALRIATVSLRKGLVPARSVVELVRREAVDVLAAQELTPDAERGLREAGLHRLLPHAHVVPARPGSVVSGSGAIWSRVPLHDLGNAPGEFEQPTARVRIGDGAEVEVVSVHTAPPATSPAAVRSWAADLATLPLPDPGVLRVLAGDFNATPDHAALRAVLRRGWVDAAQALGLGSTWTWRPLRPPFPRLVLDHVLVDPRLGVRGCSFARVPGSDHRAVVVDLAVPAAAR